MLDSGRLGTSTVDLYLKISKSPIAAMASHYPCGSVASVVLSSPTTKNLVN